MAPRKISIATLIAAQARHRSRKQKPFVDWHITYTRCWRQLSHLFTINFTPVGIYGWKGSGGAKRIFCSRVHRSGSIRANFRRAWDGVSRRRRTDLLYVVNGDFVDWMFGVFGAYGYTPELRPTTPDFYPPPSEIIPTFEENIPPPYILFAPPFCTTVP